MPSEFNKTDQWRTDFIYSHPVFQFLEPFSGDFIKQFKNWPQLDDFQRFFQSGAGSIRSGDNAQITFVAQGRKPERVEDHYEPRIFLKGEIQTRLQNWHDFFQVMIWRVFPKTKVALNTLHYHAFINRLNSPGPESKQRCALENVLTQFDECGGIILSYDADVLKKIRNFEWKSLFWHKRDSVCMNLKCFVFGHALLEKCLAPYIGMTAHCILLPVSQSIFEYDTTQIISEIDNTISRQLLHNNLLSMPSDLQPFPILGLPGWHNDNDKEYFYDNPDYFRNGRRNKPSSRFN